MRCEKYYSVSDHIMFFYIFSISGWLWEAALFIVSQQQFVNRGFLHGPWLPIYGTASVIILLCFGTRTQKLPFVFGMILLVSGSIEYVTAWYLETFHHAKWWDYSGYRFQLHGRISLVGLIVFAAGGCLVVYIFAPILKKLLKKIPSKIIVGLCIMLTIIFLADWIYSFISPNDNGVVSDNQKSIDNPIQQRYTV